MRRAFPLFASEGLAVRVLPLPAGLDPDTYAFQHGVELFQNPWDKAQPWFAFLVEELIAAHGLDMEGRVRIAEELRPYFQALVDPVEQGLWLKFTGERLGVDEVALRQSLATQTQAPAAPRRLDPAGHLAINLERSLLKWVLHQPSSLEVAELEEWAGEFEDRELQGLMHLIINNFREHGALDHSLLLERVEEEHLKKQICALTLEEGEYNGSPGELLADDWRRAWLRRRLKKARARIKRELEKAAADPGGEELLALLAQRQEIDRQLDDLK
jgi:DNA primase